MIPGIFFSPAFQEVRGAYLPACYVGTEGSGGGAFSPDRREADHSFPCGGKVKKEWRCTFSSPYTFMACTDLIT